MTYLSYFRGSCTILDDLSDSIIITGGMTNDVARYDVLGYVEYLPSMIRIRNSHGCGSYVNTEGQMVLFNAMLEFVNTIH